MYFKESGENRKLTGRLEAVVRSGRVSHAYIFEGDRNIDKKGFALAFIKGILCPDGRGENCGRCGICSKVDHSNHEDIIIVSRDNGTVKDEDIVKVQERLRTKPFGERNIVLIENADRMTQRAQNRLLKTLEEPPGDSVVILLSENIENLVKTIQSRCVKYRLNSFREVKSAMSEKADSFVRAILKGAPFYIMKDMTEKILDSDDDPVEFLDCVQIRYRNLLVDIYEGRISDRKIKPEYIMEAAAAVEYAKTQLRYGVSPRHAVRNLILKIGG